MPKSVAKRSNFTFEQRQYLTMKPLAFLIILSCFITAFAQDENRTKHYNLEDNLGIQGYDPVAYFTAEKATKGKKEFEYTHQGIPYRFSSKQNLETFKGNPGMYEPAYGGWCAYAMGVNGDKVEIDPKTFKIVDGELNLFYNFYFNNTLKDWNKDESNLKPKAKENWSQIVGQN